MDSEVIDEKNTSKNNVVIDETIQSTLKKDSNVEIDLGHYSFEFVDLFGFESGLDSVAISTPAARGGMGVDRLDVENDKIINYTIEKKSHQLNRDSEEEHKSTDVKERKDVINKTLLRSIRRFFHFKFKNEYKRSRFRSTEKRIIQFQITLRQFLDTLIEGLPTADWTDQTFDDIRQILGTFVNPLMNKKSNIRERHIISNDVRNFLKKFEICCKSYTHIALEELCDDKYFGIVFTLFKHSLSEKYTKMLKVMWKNIEIYDQAILNLSDQVEGTVRYQ